LDGGPLIVPEENAYTKERIDKVPYIQWKKDGFVNFTEGNVIDHTYIKKKIIELSKEYNIVDIAYDTYNAVQMATELHNEEGIEMSAYGLGIISMIVAAKKFEKLVLSKKLKHGGNPVLTWCASNVKVKMDENENIKPVKNKNFQRIDCVIALMMAVGRMTTLDTSEHKSVYEDRGVISF
jgi:phage terminase large subunit-like protein